MQQGSLTEKSVQCHNSHSCVVPLLGPWVVVRKRFQKSLIKNIRTYGGNKISGVQQAMLFNLHIKLPLFIIH